METEPVGALRAARATGSPEFVTTPTRVRSTGLVIPPIRARTDGPRWVVEDDWHWVGPGWKLTVPRGWDTDLASVPALLRRWLNAFQLGITGPLVHDGDPPKGTCNPPRRFTRREADRLLLDLMRRERVRPWRRWAGYAVTRALGWSHWGVRGSRLD